MLPYSDWINEYIAKLLICEVNTILGFNTLFSVVIPKDGREICPSPSNSPAKTSNLDYYCFQIL